MHWRSYVNAFTKYTYHARRAGSLAIVCGLLLVSFVLTTTMPTEHNEIRYNESELMLLRNNVTTSRVQLPQEVSINIDRLGIARIDQHRRMRGRRGGSHMRRHITVVKPIPRRKHLPIPSRKANVIQLIRSDRRKEHFPSILLTNIRSMNNKLDELYATVQVNQADLVAVTETWFSDSKPAEANEMKGYNLLHKDRADKRGGGVALYARNDLHATPFGAELTPKHLEILWAKASLRSYVRNSVNLFICVVYAPPNTPMKEEIIDHVIYMSDYIRNSF